MSASTDSKAVVTRQRPRVELSRKGDCYDYHVETFTRWMAERGYTDPFEAVTEYFRDLNNSTYKAGTVRMKRQAVKNRLRLVAESSGLDPQRQYQLDLFLRRLDQDADTKAPKLNNAGIGVSKVIDQGEYERLVVGSRSTRQRLFIKFLWSTGCRVSEMTGALLRNCDREGKTVRVRVMGKGRKEREVTITAALFDAIQAEFAGSEFLFETSGGKPYRRSYVSEQIAKQALQVLGRRISAHKLRHSFATRMIEKTHKISAVSKYLGHSSVSTTLGMYNHEQLDLVELLGEEVAV